MIEADSGSTCWPFDRDEFVTALELRRERDRGQSSPIVLITFVLMYVLFFAAMLLLLFAGGLLQ